MKEYIIAIITVSIVGGIAFALVSTKDARLKKYVRLVISLIFLIVLILPIKNAVSQVNSFKDNIDSFFSSIGANVDYSNNLIINSSIDNISMGIKNALLEEFKLKSEDVSVEISVNRDNIEAIKIEKVKIYLYNEATWSNESKIEEFLDRIIGCEAIIVKK